MIDLPIRHTCVWVCQASGGEGGEWGEGRGGVGVDEQKENSGKTNGSRGRMLTILCMRPQATSVCGLTLLVYAALRS